MQQHFLRDGLGALDLLVLYWLIVQGLPKRGHDDPREA